MEKGSFEAEWTVFHSQESIVAIPKSPLLVRLRKIVSDDFFGQEPLLPLKRLMDALFFTGPGCILIALYLPGGSFPLVMLGLLSLAIASLYWFAPHWLCRHYLRYRGFSERGRVTAQDFQTALVKAS